MPPAFAKDSGEAVDNSRKDIDVLACKLLRSTRHLIDLASDFPGRTCHIPCETTGAAQRAKRMRSSNLTSISADPSAQVAVIIERSGLGRDAWWPCVEVPAPAFRTKRF